jgi:rhodanese-related sulfurtransferase
MKLYQVALLVLLSFSALSANANNTAVISQTNFIALQQSEQPAIVLDVRSVEEFEKGHIAGAINIPHDTIAERLDELTNFKQQKVVVYCRSGRRAGIAENILADNGFEQLLHLDGDMNGWQAAKLPEERK